MSDLFTLPRGAYGLVVPDGIRTQDDLAELLPSEVLERGAGELLDDAGNAAALRLLALIDDTAWHEFVSAKGISYLLLVHWSRLPGAVGLRERTLAEIALALAGDYHARVDLLDVARRLGETDFLAVIDALRIAREGLPA